MTLDEVNAKIRAMEAELKELKALKKQLQGMDIFDEEKKKWLRDVMRVVGESRKNATREEFEAAVKRVPRYEMQWLGRWFWVFRDGLEEERLLHGWRILLGTTIASVTHGKKTGIKDKETQKCQLTEDEIVEIKKRLKERINRWCRIWKGRKENGRN